MTDYEAACELYEEARRDLDTSAKLGLFDTIDRVIALNEAIAIALRWKIETAGPGPSETVRRFQEAWGNDCIPGVKGNRLHLEK